METIRSLQPAISQSHLSLIEKTGKGNNFTGWVQLPQNTSPDFLSTIEQEVLKIKKIAEVVVVIGIGGSYLGAKAVIDALSHHFSSLKSTRESPLILYAGQNLSEDYISDLIEILNTKEYAIIVISKSGTTTEPAVAFRILKDHIKKKYGKNALKNRVVVITDKEKGALKKLADDEGYTTFIIPDDVGGRYSVFTPVGLFPIAVAGFNIRKLIAGAQLMQQYLTSQSGMVVNPAALYAATRNALYRKSFTTEIFVSYEPRLLYLAEWWKQLFGESEGKELKGIFPATVSNTTDLHSMGQYIQQGQRNIFETVISVKNPDKTITVPFEEENSDGINFLAGKRVYAINHKAELGTLLAHIDGGVPNLVVEIPSINEYTLGQLLYFFEYACALSGYLLQVNPFDQPGVEDYKKNMFALLDKPGFEEESQKIKKRLLL
jgi:glucose-6-phosphate isomerase